MINVKKLTKELISAGISINGCNEFGIVWDTENNEIQDRADVAEVVALHNPTPEADSVIVYDKSIQAPLLNLIEYIDDLEKRVDVLEKAKLK